MNAMIGRPSGSLQRVFPRIESGLYDLPDEPGSLTPDQQAARNLLALAKRDLTRRQRLIGWKLDFVSRLGRLLFHHRIAIEAELAGKWRRADYFWNLIQQELRILSADDQGWGALVPNLLTVPGAFIMDDPLLVRQRLVEEIFIDTHCAFYNGKVRREAELTLVDRAFRHVHLISELVELSGLSPDEQFSLFYTPALAQMGLCQEAQRWEQAIQVGEEILGRFPESQGLQDKVANLVLLEGLNKLGKSTTPSESLKDAQILDRSISHLETMLEAYPYNLTIFELLGDLHHLRAIRLANGNDFPDALVSVQKALTFNPFLEKAKEDKEKLIELMNGFISQMESIEADLAKQPGRILSAEGLKMKYQASRGFGPMNEYIESEEAEETVENHHSAYARRIWNIIGLAEPDDQWDQTAKSLLHSLGEVMNDPPSDKSGIKKAWKEVSAEDETLASLNSELICAFLDRRLFGGEENAEAEKTSTMLPEDPQILESAFEERRGGGEPFEYWLFSLQDMRLKIQAAAAVVLVLVGIGLATREFLHRQARDQAYEQILTASAHKDYHKVIECAEIFFRNPILSGKDGRDQQVRDLYDEGLVRWFVEKDGVLDADAQAHLERHRALIVPIETGR